MKEIDLTNVFWPLVRILPKLPSQNISSVVSLDRLYKIHPSVINLPGDQYISSKSLLDLILFASRHTVYPSQIQELNRCIGILEKTENCLSIDSLFENLKI